MARDPGEMLRRSGGEPEAFAGFYESQFEPVLAYLARRLYDADAALDLTAEVFAQAYLSRRRFRGGTRPEAEAWIYRIAERQLARYLRRGAAETRARQRLQLQAPAITAERRAAIEHLAELDGLRSVLRSELARLSEAQREAVGLRILGDLPFSEVAQRLGITEQTARARVSRGLSTLAAALENNPTIKEMS